MAGGWSSQFPHLPAGPKHTSGGTTRRRVELKLSPVEAYQAVYPLVVAGLADREGDGRIKLLIKVVDEK